MVRWRSISLCFPNSSHLREVRRWIVQRGLAGCSTIERRETSLAKVRLSMISANAAQKRRTMGISLALAGIAACQMVSGLLPWWRVGNRGTSLGISGMRGSLAVTILAEVVLVTTLYGMTVTSKPDHVLRWWQLIGGLGTQVSAIATAGLTRHSAAQVANLASVNSLCHHGVPCEPYGVHPAVGLYLTLIAGVLMLFLLGVGVPAGERSLGDAVVVPTRDLRE